MTNDGPELFEKVNSTPKYLFAQNGYKALDLLDIDSHPIAYLKMVDPSVANRARGGKKGDFLRKVNAYLEENKK